MTVGTVVGEVYSTINHPFYDGRKLLVVRKGEQPGSGDYLIAVDAVGAGVGERVLILDEGNGARQVLESGNGPVRSVIVGIVDLVEESRLGS